jgi:cyclopropane fatty-acyl-phospholipid synthase-like methyltransferase
VGAASRIRQGLRGLFSGPQPSRYGSLYESHAQSEREDAIGGGDYVTMGEIELDALRVEGLKPSHRLVDFGCGTGRLAGAAIPYLDDGIFVGIDISPTFLERAEASTSAVQAASGCQVHWAHQDGLDFDLEPASVDFMSAFSVFTHMEHEDTFRYLRAIRPLMAPDGRFVLSCLPLELVDAEQILLAEASMSHDDRWQRVRNVVTSVDLMDALIGLAGWTIVSWRRGDEDLIPSVDGQARRLGQSIVTIAPS